MNFGERMEKRLELLARDTDMEVIRFWLAYFGIGGVGGGLVLWLLFGGLF